MSLNDMKVERTGNTYSIASKEYLVTFPDGTQQTIWSPPWNSYDNEKDEDDAALEYAVEIWISRSPMSGGMKNFIKTYFARKNVNKT